MVRLIVISLGVYLLTSCVPARLLDESKSKLNKCETELQSLKKSSQENEAILAELREKATRDRKSIEGLRHDSTIVGGNLRNLMAKYDKLNVLNEQLLDRYN